MGNVKFTFVKLIPKYFLLASLIILLPFSGNSGMIQNQSIKKFPHRNQINFQKKYTLLFNSYIFTNTLTAIVDSDEKNQQLITEQSVADKSEDGYQSNNLSEEIVETDGNNTILDLFFTQEEITSARKKLIDYGINNFPEMLTPAYIAVVEKSFEYPIILLFVFLVIFFILNIVFMFVVLNYTIKRKSYKERFEKIYSKMYEEVLLAYMFGSINWETVKLKLKQHNKKENRKILVSVLLNFKSSFKGELEHFIPDIYTKLKLNKDSLKLANSYYNHKKVRGIIELIHLYPEGAKDIVKKRINDPNDYVRAEAQTAYIRLNPETPFNFFYTLEKPFTRWTQLSAFNLIRIHQLKVPSFGQFLNFKHYNIKNFSLRMITYFQQLETASDVIKKVDDEMEQTRYLAYKAINDLRLYDSLELIKIKYEKETLRNKLEIIRTLKNIGTNKEYDFLFEVMETGTTSLKTEACRSMYYMSSDSRERLLRADARFVHDIKLLIEHVTDPRN